ncbi:MAG: hypothetical protein HY295_06380 [Thaumarchaeota archaeon]|nr:hypothetical protein [Nitrososphaerota archaeon]
MNHKLKYLGLLAIIPVFTVALTSNSMAFALSKYENPDNHITAQYKQGLVCGNKLCSQGGVSLIKQKITTVPKPGPKGTKAPTTPAQDLGSVLRLSDANLPLVMPLVRGLYDGKDVFYISTEASDSDVATLLTKFTNFPVTFAPALAKTPDKGLANIFVFKNGVNGVGVLGFQPNVVDSIPGQSKYSALWKINFVEWKDSATAKVLGSDDEIADAQTKGQVTVTPTNVVVNCPIVQWGGDKENTIPAGHMKIKESSVLTDTTPYGGGQVLNIDTQKMQVTFVAHRGFGSDGSTIYYIVTDASMQDPSNMMGVTFANKTAALIVSSASSDLFQFTNGIQGTGPMGFQAGIGSTKPGDVAYSPIWRISMISWNDASSASVLENTHDITSHSDKIKVTPAGMVVNCPFINANTVYTHMK